MSENKGESSVANQTYKKWVGTKRPFGWRRAVYGLVGHTTGSSLPSKAKDAGQEVHERAAAHYQNSHGTHYVIPYDGNTIQVANECMQANGVGMADQRKSVIGGNWVHESLPAVEAFSKWIGRWSAPGVSTPLDLFPTKSANSCYVHAEMPPCVFFWNGKLHTEAEPMREGLRFTKAQHDAMAELSVDIADRNKWPKEWWKTGRLVGHEDISPITRHTSAGCWDPGYLRAHPWFDWAYIKSKIENEYENRRVLMAALDEIQEEIRTAPCGPSPAENVMQAFVDWVSKFFTKKEK